MRQLVVVVAACEGAELRKHPSFALAGRPRVGEVRMGTHHKQLSVRHHGRNDLLGGVLTFTQESREFLRVKHTPGLVKRLGLLHL